MAVNGIEIAIGQRWKTRDGGEVELVGNDGHSTYPWDLSNGFCVTNQGQVLEFTEDDCDLIALIRDEHGFIPWNGGECPVGEGVKVEAKFSDGFTHPALAGDYYWKHKGTQQDIIAYRVVEQEVKPTKVDVEENKGIVKMNHKYTVKDVLYALDNLSDEYVELDLEEQIEEYLAVRESADYKLYLELKAKFEKE